MTVKTTEQTTDELRRHDTLRDPGASQTTGGPGGSGFAAVLGAPGILALQRSAGNRATTAWIESQRTASASALHRSKSARSAPISVQRRLLSQTSDALQAAKEHNAALFGTLSSVVDRYVPDDEQKKINNVEPASMKVSNFFAKIGRSLARTPANGQDERAGLLTKLVRAVIYHEYVDRIEPLENSKDLDPREKAKTRSRYFERTLLNRDKQAGLLRKGVGSAEAQAFLQKWGLLADQAKATEEESSSHLKNAPRVDVRSTFIGGTKLGINLRAHLYIVYTLADGRMFYIRGGPGTDIDGNDRPLGSTTVEVGLYAPGTVDWDPSAPSKTVLTGTAADGKLDAFIEAAFAINSMKVPYVARMRHKASLLSGENCNAAAWTVLDRVGLPKAKPSGVHPGWGHQLGQHSGKGNKMPEVEPDTLETEGELPNEVTVYRDRGGIEFLTKLPQDTHIKAIGIIGDGIVKISFEAGGKPAVGFIDVNDLNVNAKGSEVEEQDKAKSDVPYWRPRPGSGDEDPAGKLEKGEQFLFRWVEEEAIERKGIKYVEVMYMKLGECYMRVEDLRRAGYPGKLPGDGADLAPKGEDSDHRDKANAVEEHEVEEHEVKEHEIEKQGRAKSDVFIWLTFPTSGDEQPGPKLAKGAKFDFHHVDADTAHEDRKGIKYVEVMYQGYGFCYMRVEDLRRAGYAGKLPGDGADLAPKGEDSDHRDKANAVEEHEKVDEHPVNF